MRALAAIVVAIIVLAAGSEAMACDVDGFTPSKIGTHTLNITQIFMGFPQWYLWTINLCEPTSDHPPQAASGCGVPGYINEFGDSGNGIGCLTSLSTIATTYAKNATTGNFEVMFANDKNWEAKVSVSCGGDSALASTSDIMVVGDHNHLVFEFNLQSNVICEGGGKKSGGGGKKKSGLTGGGWFVLVFFLGAFFYVCGTVAFYYFKQGKRGKELLPHPEFWASVPGLIKDGVFFTKDKIMQCVESIRNRGSGGESSSAAEAKYESV